MWESCLRGVDCGKLRLQDFFLPSGSSAQLPLPEPLSAGSQLVIRPNGSKTVKGRRAGAISLVHTGSDVHCSLPRLMRYLGARAAAPASSTPASGFNETRGMTCNLKEEKDIAKDAYDYAMSQRRNIVRCQAGQMCAQNIICQR